VAEFIGTFALVFFITLTVSLYVTPPVNGSQPFIDFSVIGLVHFLLLFMLVQTLAVVSGAHFNPAVTLALFAIRQIRAADAVIYWLCQLAGAVAAALATKALVLDEGAATNYGAPAVSSHITVFGGICAEAIGTFFLVWAIVGVAVNPRAVMGWAGLVIGGARRAWVLARRDQVDPHLRGRPVRGRRRRGAGVPHDVHPAREEGRRGNAAGGLARPRGPSSPAGRPRGGA
jgi:glycerol uptake facilitator-like aquaporin